MKPCRYCIVNGINGLVCQRGVQPMNCKSCSQFAPVHFYTKPVAAIIQPDQNNQLPVMPYTGGAVVPPARAATAGGCNCGKH